MRRLTADVLVVGAGTSGCVLAARLSASSRCSVVLVEAGAATPRVRGPLDSDSIASSRFPGLDRSRHDQLWRYRNESGTAATIRGRGVGGSGTVNGAYYLRALPEDFRDWGSPLWSPEHVERIWVAMETDADFGGHHHGGSGPVPVERFRQVPLGVAHEAFLAGALAAGIPEKPDHNDPVGSGIGLMPRNSRGGVRMAADATHLIPALGRANLTVLTETVIERVLIDSGDCYGAVGRDPSGAVSIEAGRVVLCAGAIGSPLILAASGIGCGDDLRRIGVPVRHALPGVGANLRDHPAIAVELADAPTGLTGEPATRLTMTLTSPDSPLRTDMQVFLSTAYPGSAQSARLVCMAQAPRSVGRLRWRRDHGDVGATIRYGYLEDPADVEAFVSTLRTSLSILESGAARRIVAMRPMSRSGDVRTAAAHDWVRGSLETFFHTSGTCAMGRADDPVAVVDERGSVHGLGGLTVADLSIVPRQLRANTNATAFLIGERIAELLTEGDVS